MKTKTPRTSSLNHTLITTLLALVLATPLAVSAAKGNPVVEVAGMAFNVDHTMVDNLKAHVGKRLTLYLSSGTQISGKVKTLSQHMVHMETISKRDLMDALIQIKSIEAIEGQFRAYQRDLERMGLKKK
ncbi:MAG: hypothetical protein GY792_28490 [Gammaproteobacteria bacterium]|nr:hypothetical protein [Gammaproteobacteria bacterium]